MNTKPLIMMGFDELRAIQNNSSLPHADRCGACAELFKRWRQNGNRGVDPLRHSIEADALFHTWRPMTIHKLVIVAK